MGAVCRMKIIRDALLTACVSSFSQVEGEAALRLKANVIPRGKMRMLTGH